MAAAEQRTAHAECAYDQSADLVISDVCGFSRGSTGSTGSADRRICGPRLFLGQKMIGAEPSPIRVNGAQRAGELLADVRR
jgi:hypothetical protein